MRNCALLLSVICLSFMEFGAQKVQKPHIYYLHIQSDIRYRFATTLVTSRVANPAEVAQETVFQVNLPKEAFISNFSMQIDDKIYAGDVKEKEAAKRAYDRAKKKGHSAGHVTAKPRETNSFKIQVNVAALSKVTFNLTYQELLQRRLGVYEHQIYVNPGRIVHFLKVEVNIQESREITMLRVPPIRNDLLSDIDISGSNTLAIIEQPTSSSAYILYEADETQQLAASQLGVAGLFEVQYDIERNYDAGDVLVVNGYFVHFIAPKGLEPMPKNIIFILDLSSSMYGDKIRQLKEAMLIILGDLREGDHFNIVTFNSVARVWKKTLLSVTKKNIEAAKTFIRNMIPGGYTNINDALLTGIGAMDVSAKRVSDTPDTLVPIIVFLTDGQPSTGIQNPEAIKRNVRNANKEIIPIFSLAFGDDADYNMLKQMSSQNNGIARKIYESSDVTLQMTGFYDEIGTSIMSNVQVKYLDNSTDAASVTATSFQNYFNGTEMIIAGKLNDKVPTLSLEIDGMGKDGPVTLKLDAQVPKREPSPKLSGADDYTGVTEKLWAYLTIKQLMEQMLREDNPVITESLKNKALELSLKYKFVTPLTSMVVTKPEKEKRQSGTPDIDESANREKWGGSRRAQPGRPSHAGSADNDPHFIVNINGLDKPVCFDVMGKPGDIYRLIRDPVSGITVNAEVVADKAPRNSAASLKTYLGKISIIRRDFKLVVRPASLRIDGITYSWRNETVMLKHGMRITVNGGGKRIVVSLGSAIELMIIRHRVSRKNPKRADFLGFYISESGGLSKKTHGLLGQFVHRKVTSHPMTPHNSRARIRIQTTSKHTNETNVVASLGQRLDLATDAHVSCWMVQNNGHGIIRGEHTDYLTKRLTAP